MLQYVGETLCISHAGLTGTDHPLMSPSLVGYYQRTGRLVQLQRGGNGREALFAVDSLPPRCRDEVYRRNPDLQTAAQALPFARSITLDGAAHAFFTDYTCNGRHLPPSVVDEYTCNASILNRFTEMLDKARSQRAKLGARPLRITAFWADKAALLPLVADTLGHSLPTHPRRLQARYNAYLREGYVSLVSKKYANTNASKITSPEQEAVLIRLLGDHRNWDNVRVAELYNFIASKMPAEQRWRPLTARAVGYLRRKYDLLTTASRRGSDAFHNTRAMQVKRSAPTAPLLYWTADGWDVELFYQKSEERGGRRVTTYSNRVTLVVVLDAFNKYPVGYAVGDHETPELIRAALRDAVDHTRTLFGTRYRTNQFQCDRYAIKTLTPVYAAIAGAVTPARAHNAKAKVIEPYFNRLNRKYCQLLPNWSGFGITSRRDRQPNTEFQNRIRRQFPDLAGVIEQVTRIMEAERAARRADYVAGFAALAEERRLPFATESYLLTFGRDTGRRHAIEGAGLRPTIGGVKRVYDSFDPTFRSHAHLRWEVRYDPSDLSQALAVSEDGALRFLLEEKHVQPMALADRRAGDAEALRRIEAFNRGLADDVIARYSRSHAASEQLLTGHPDLRNTLAATLLCNSLGQHKDERNALRRALERGFASDGASGQVFGAGNELGAGHSAGKVPSDQTALSAALPAAFLADGNPVPGTGSGADAGDSDGTFSCADPGADFSNSPNPGFGRCPAPETAEPGSRAADARRRKRHPLPASPLARVSPAAAGRAAEAAENTYDLY